MYILCISMYIFIWRMEMHWVQNGICCSRGMSPLWPRLSPPTGSWPRLRPAKNKLQSGLHILVSSGVMLSHEITWKYIHEATSESSLPLAEILHFIKLTLSQFQCRASPYLPAPLLRYSEPWFAGITQLSASTPLSFTILLLSYELVKAASCPVALGPYEIGSFWWVH